MKKPNTPASKQLYLNSVLANTEKMSGLDGSDNEGNMSSFDDYDNFDDDEMSYFDDGDDFSYASGGGARQMPLSDPYIVQYENTTVGTLTAVLYGYNDYFGAVNFGNPVGITVTNLQGGTYGRLIAQSNNKNFKIGRWRLQSANTNQLAQTMQLNHVDANGKQYSVPLNLSVARDAYQQQNDVLDVTKVLTVDANTFITFPMLANTILVIAMYPIAILSGKAQLNGGVAFNQAKAPRLSGKNVAPVIIQTSQGVQGINAKN